MTATSSHKQVIFSVCNAVWSLAGEEKCQAYVIWRYKHRDTPPGNQKFRECQSFQLTGHNDTDC